MYHSYIENTCLVSGNQDFCGTIKGNVIVEHNVIFVNYGMICGDVNVKEGATFINRGTVNGNVSGDGNAEIIGLLNGKLSTRHYNVYRGAVIDGMCCEEDIRK